MYNHRQIVFGYTPL